MKNFINYLKNKKEPITQNQTDQEDFLKLTQELIHYQNFSTHQNNIVNVIKQLILYAIKGDNELHKQLFELFMEKDILTRLYDIMQKNLCPTFLIQEIFEQVCSLLLNIKEITNKNYILSHNCISNMVLWKTLFECSDPNIEVIETYISFLNLLAVKLDDVTSMFFINIKYPQFPLLWNAIRFHSHPELMVRNKSRSIVLHILNIKNSNINAYCSSFPFTYYYFCLGDQLLLTIKQINNIVEQINWNFENQKYQNLHTITEELKEQLQYIHDLILNNQNLEQIILDYALQRSIIYLQQVIKHRLQHISITVALYVFYLFLRSFNNQNKVLQYFMFVFSLQDQPKIIISKDTWEYCNVLDQDPLFVQKLCKQIYQTLEPIELESISHENLDIKLCLQRLKQIDCIIIQQFIQENYFDQVNQILNIIFMHQINKDTLLYVLLLYKQLHNPLTQKHFLEQIYKFIVLDDQQLIVLMLSLDILYEQKNILDINQQIKQFYIIIVKELIQNIQKGFLFMDQLIDLFKKKMTQIEQDFILGEQINFKQQNHPIFFDPYNSLSHQQKINYCILLSQHQIFNKFPILSEQMPELTKLKVQKYQIGDKVDCETIPCQYSETGLFYNIEVYYILKIDNFLHIVQMDENQIITDIINSKLWQLLSLYGSENNNMLQITYYDFTKFYLRFKTQDETTLLNALASHQQQQFSEWFKDLLIEKLQTLLN